MTDWIYSLTWFYNFLLTCTCCLSQHTSHPQYTGALWSTDSGNFFFSGKCLYFSFLHILNIFNFPTLLAYTVPRSSRMRWVSTRWSGSDFSLREVTDLTYSVLHDFTIFFNLHMLFEPAYKSPPIIQVLAGQLKYSGLWKFFFFFPSGKCLYSLLTACFFYIFFSLCTLSPACNVAAKVVMSLD